MVEGGRVLKGKKRATTTETTKKTRGGSRESGIFPIKKMAEWRTTRVLSNVIKPTSVLLSSNKRQYLLSEKFLMKTAASFSYI